MVISVLFSLLVLVLVMVIAYYIVGMIPLPEPAKNIVLIILGLIFLLILINQLGFLGGFALLR